jgi:hypothetical protein
LNTKKGWNLSPFENRLRNNSQLFSYFRKGSNRVI